MATKKTEVAISEANPFAVVAPEHINLNSNRGSQDVGMEDIALPRISIIQDLSPQHKKNKPEYIEGAEPGMIFNSVTSELYGDKLFVVPVYYAKEWLIWKDQDKGGGFRGSFDTELEAARERDTFDDANDLEVVDTAQHYVLLVFPQPDGSFHTQEAVISMAKSQMKVNRKWNSAIRMAGGDRFSRVHTLTVVEDSNSAGQEYYNWKVTTAGFCPADVFKAAESMYESVNKGKRKIVHDSAPAPDEEVEDTEEAEM